MTIRLLLVAEHDLTRQGLRAVLQSEPDIEVVGDGKGSRDVLDKVLALRPDVVLMNTTVSHEDGVTATRAIKQNCPQTHVLILTPHADQEHFGQAMAAGASGYELTDISTTHLANAIRAVYKGKTAVNQTVIKQMAESLAANAHASPHPAQEPHALHGLTQREIQVLSHVAKGLSDKEIAAKLFLSEATVKSHLRIIYARLNIHNRAQATAFAVQRGLIAPP